MNVRAHGRLCSIALALSVVALPLHVHAEPVPAAPSTEATGPTVSFGAEPDLFDPTWHQGLVEERVAAALAAEPPLETPDRIEVSLGGSALGYRITVTALRHGTALPSSGSTTACECSTTEMLEKVQDLVVEAGQLLRDAAAQERADAAAAEEQARLQQEREREQARQLRQERRDELAARRYRPERLGFFGALGIAVGGTAAVTGIALVAKGDGAPSDYAELRPKDLRPPGYALLGAGAAVLTAGVAMLVIDVVRCRRDRVVCGGRKGAFAWRTPPATPGATYRW